LLAHEVVIVLIPKFWSGFYGATKAKTGFSQLSKHRHRTESSFTKRSHINISTHSWAELNI
jgi:hypothetical protein